MANPTTSLAPVQRQNQPKVHKTINKQDNLAPNTATGQKKRVHLVQPRVETPTEQADSSSDEDYVFSVNKINSVSCPKELETSVNMNDSAEIKMVIDTRAFFEQFGQKNFEKPEAGKEQGTHFAYGSNTPIPLLGKVTTEIQTNTTNYCCDLLYSQRKIHLIDVISNCLRAGLNYNKHWQVNKCGLHQK